MALYDLQWNEGRIEEAFNLTSMFGATDHQMAVLMRVDDNTIAYWKRSHPEFKEAIERGKLLADIEVAKSWYRCANGFEYEEEVSHMYKGQIIKTKVKKYSKPDPWSCAKWLAIRQRENWTDVSRVEVTNTNININKIDLTGVTKEEMLLMEKIQMRQLTDHVGDS